MADLVLAMILPVSLLIWLHLALGCVLLHEGSIDANVYYDWPFSIACTRAIHYYYDDDKFPESMMIGIYKEYKPLECTIRNIENGVILLNSTQNVSMSAYDDEVGISGYNYQIKKVTDALSSKFQITLTKRGLCWKVNITLHKIKLYDESCEENLRRSQTIETPIYTNRIKRFPCEVPSDVLHEPRSLIRSDEFDRIKAQVIWLHNCDKALPNNSRISPRKHLQIQGVQYSHNLGVYTCSILYNGMIRYRVHHRACATPPTSRMLSAECNSVVARISSNASVECNIDAGVSDSPYHGCRGFFHKLPYREESGLVRNQFYCQSIGEQDQGQRITCSLNRSQHSVDKCYREALTNDEIEAHKTKFKFIYKINDVRESDFGDFLLVFMNADNMNVTVKFTLQADTKLYLIQTQWFIMTVLVTLAGIFLMYLFLRKCVDMEVRWIWHNLCRPYEKDRKAYVGYLTYYFSEDMTETVPSQLKSFVYCLNSHLRRKGGEMFDGYKDSSPYQYTTERMTNKLGQCYRVIIILTPEYVKDNWGVHETYQAWKSAIENVRVKIIFVVFPTTITVINDLPGGLRTTLHKALKRHNVIHWDGVLPISRRIRMHLDLLMPKLPAFQHYKTHNDKSIGDCETDGMFVELVSKEAPDNLWECA